MADGSDQQGNYVDPVASVKMISAEVWEGEALIKTVSKSWHYKKYSKQKQLYLRLKTTEGRLSAKAESNRPRSLLSEYTTAREKVK